MNITDGIANELTEPSIDLLIDYSEIAFDNIIDNELLSSFPLVKTAKNFMHLGFLLKEKSFIKRTLIFLKKFHTNKIDKTSMAEFRVRFDNETKYRSDVIETIVLAIDRAYDNIKPKILANLFSAHLENNISWAEFQALNQCLDKLHTIGIRNFKRAATMKFDEELLASDMYDVVPYILSSGLGTLYDKRFSLNPLGHKMFKYGIQPLN